jgi:hypothetical protein
MGFMDKVMSKAAEVGKAGQAKVDTVQTKRQVDDLLRHLGLLTYAEKAGRAKPEDASQVDDTMAKLGEMEGTHPDLFVASAPSGTPGTPTAPVATFPIGGMVAGGAAPTSASPAPGPGPDNEE